MEYGKRPKNVPLDGCCCLFAGAETLLVVVVEVTAVVEVVEDENPLLLRTLALNEDGRTLEEVVVGGGLSVLPFVCSSLGFLRGSSLTRDKPEVYEAETEIN
jgi:hypothetical protein